VEVFRIEGGNCLHGEVEISGAKNSALPLFAASLLSTEDTILENVPNLSDVQFMAQLLEHLGARVEKIDPNTWRISPQNINPDPPYELVRKMRASICLLGPLVGRLKKANMPMPGGCVIGNRPIDLHLKALSDLGADIQLRGGVVEVDGAKMVGGSVFLGGRHGSTVTGTANAIMAAVLTPGSTRLEGCACEPEIVDLCSMLLSMGANIEGVGSHLLQIEGVESLHGCTHRVIPDRIEAATYILAAAITTGEITLKNASIEHLGAFTNVMKTSGVSLKDLGNGTLHIRCETAPLRSFEIITLPYPGFPTDLQAQTCALACTIPGLSILTERVYPSRFMHIPELLRMGANVSLEGSNAIVQGGKPLSGAPVMASDLRASAALILAGLAAEGETWVQRIYHLDRGYDAFDQKLQHLGAKVERLAEAEMPPSFS
jgi:UDP-N-acetylglucosamine 1-carboxyvinyltransferase